MFVKFLILDHRVTSGGALTRLCHQ